MVMTLNSVAAQAQARTSSVCASEPAETGGVVSESRDQLYREPVDVYDALVENPPGSGTFEGTGENTYFKDPIAGVWRNYGTGEEVTDLGPEGDPTDLGEKIGVGYAIVRFDPQLAQAVAAGAPAGDYTGTFITSVTGACLLSLYPNA